MGYVNKMELHKKYYTIHFNVHAIETYLKKMNTE